MIDACVCVLCACVCLCLCVLARSLAINMYMFVCVCVCLCVCLCVFVCMQLVSVRASTTKADTDNQLRLKRILHSPAFARGVKRVWEQQTVHNPHTDTHAHTHMSRIPSQSRIQAILKAYTVQLVGSISTR